MKRTKARKATRTKRSSPNSAAIEAAKVIAAELQRLEEDESDRCTDAEMHDARVSVIAAHLEMYAAGAAYAERHLATALNRGGSRG